MERVSQEQLEADSRYRRKSKIAEWLRKNHIPFYFDRYDRPVVYEENYIIGRHRAYKIKKAIEQPKTTWNPPPP